MWIRLRKELRELALPAGGVTGIALLVVPWGGEYALWVFGLLCFYLSVRPIGLELDRGTMASLLAQPIPRSRLWGEKLIAAAIPIVLGFAVVLLASWFRGLESDSFSLGSLVWPADLFPLIAIATGPTVSLLLRDSLRSFWAALALPAGLYLVAMVGWSLLGGSGPGLPAVEIVLLPYCAVMAVWGYRRFRRFQIDTAKRRSHRPRPSTEVPCPPPRNGHPSRWQVARELFSKELRLQQSSLLLVPVAVAGWGLAWLLSFRAEVRLGSGGTFGEVLAVAGFVPSVALLLVVPALIGAHAVAWERHLGVLGWQLGLPVSRHFQWLLKLACCVLLTLLVSSFLGTALTWILAQRLATEPPALPLVQLAVMPLIALAIGIWASKLAKSPFNALGLSLIVGLAGLYAWGLLTFTASLLEPGDLRVVDMWGLFCFTSSWFLTSGGMFLVNLVTAATLLVVILAPRRQEDWLVGRRGYWWAGFTAFGAVALLAFGTQIYLLNRLSADLDREIAAQDARLLRVGGSRDGLRPDLDFNQWCNRLAPINDYRWSIISIIMKDPSLRIKPSVFTHNQEWMGYTIGRAVMLDGVPFSYDSGCYWTAKQTWVPYSPAWHRDPEPWQGRVPLWRSFSLAPLWFREHRLRQLDRRMRQYVAFDTLELLGHLERSPAADPETVRRMVEDLLE